MLKKVLIIAPLVLFMALTVALLLKRNAPIANTDISNTTTYTHTNQFYTIQVPNYLEAKYLAGGIDESVIGQLELSDKNSGVIIFTLSNYSLNNSSIDNWFNSKKSILFSPNLEKKNTIVLGNTSIDQYTYAESSPNKQPSTVYVFEKGGNAYALGVTSTNENKEQTAIKLIESLSILIKE